MTWTAPTHVSSGEADSAKFNEETVDNLIHIHDTLLGGLRIEAGTGTATFSAAGSASGSGTFATAFASAPLVVLSCAQVVGEEIVINLISATTTGFTARLGVADDSAISATDLEIQYVAIGTPA